MRRTILSFGLWISVLIILVTGCFAKQGQVGNGSGIPEDILRVYPELADRKMEKMMVKRVVDGDTFETDTKLKVRLIGVNTPETVKPGSPVQPYGKEASAFTKKQLTGKNVLAFTDVEDKDKYGRLLRYIFLEGESVMFNEVLVREGYANTMTIAPNVMFSKRFVKVEREAREKNRGLWGKK